MTETSLEEESKIENEHQDEAKPGNADGSF